MIRRAGAALLLVAGAGAGCSKTTDNPVGAHEAGLTGDSEVGSCGATPFDLPVTEETTSSAFAVTLVAAAPSNFSLGDNDWTLTVAGADGKPAPGLSFNVVPWMPVHRHGSARTVVVTDAGNGEYEAKPINVSMPGVWEIRVDFPGDGGTPDRAVFSFCATAR